METLNEFKFVPGIKDADVGWIDSRLVSACL